MYESVVRVLEGDGQIRRRRYGYEGLFGNVWEVILGYERLLEMLEKKKKEAGDFHDPKHFRTGINLAWDKLEKYYTSKSYSNCE